MNPKPLLATLLLTTGLSAAAQVTLAPLPTHAPKGLSTQLQAALVMGQAPALWLVLAVERTDALGQVRRTELHMQGRDAADLVEALADRMEATFGTLAPVPPDVEEPVQARRAH